MNRSIAYIFKMSASPELKFSGEGHKRACQIPWPDLTRVISVTDQKRKLLKDANIPVHSEMFGCMEIYGQMLWLLLLRG